MTASAVWLLYRRGGQIRTQQLAAYSKPQALFMGAVSVALGWQYCEVTWCKITKYSTHKKAVLMCIYLGYLKHNNTKKFAYDIFSSSNFGIHSINWRNEYSDTISLGRLDRVVGTEEWIPGAHYFLFNHTSPKVHPALYTVRTRSFPWVKQLGHGADNPPHPNTEVMHGSELLLPLPCLHRHVMGCSLE